MPEIAIVEDMDDLDVLKSASRERASTCTGCDRCAKASSRTAVYIVASQIMTPADVVRVLPHETLAHFCLCGLYG